MVARGAVYAIIRQLRGPMLDKQLSSRQRVSREKPHTHLDLYIHTVTQGGAGLGGCKLRLEYSAWISLKDWFS